MRYKGRVPKLAKHAKRALHLYGKADVKPGRKDGPCEQLSNGQADPETYLTNRGRDIHRSYSHAPARSWSWPTRVFWRIQHHRSRAFACGDSAAIRHAPHGRGPPETRMPCLRQRQHTLVGSMKRRTSWRGVVDSRDAQRRPLSHRESNPPPRHLPLCDPRAPRGRPPHDVIPPAACGFRSLQGFGELRRRAHPAFAPDCAAVGVVSFVAAHLDASARQNFAQPVQRTWLRPHLGMWSASSAGGHRVTPALSAWDDHTFGTCPCFAQPVVEADGR